MALYWETVDIPVLIKDVITTVKPLMENNGNVLEVHCDERLGTMYADLTKVRQVLFNLLSNAAKFTHQGKVTLTVTRGEPHDLALGCQQQEPAAVVSSLYTRRCLNHAQVWRYWTRVGD
jgi:signal transduction histidine kinase